MRSACVRLAEDYSPDAVIEMWRANAAEWALRGRLGAVAATVIDGESNAGCVKNRVPVRFPRMAATTLGDGRTR